jgi:hypothetical protein
MEHDVSSVCSGTVRQVVVKLGDVVRAGQTVLSVLVVNVFFFLSRSHTWSYFSSFIEPSNQTDTSVKHTEEVDLDFIRPDLKAMYERRELISLHGGRSAAVEKRHRRGMRFVWENVYDMFEKDSFVEFGGGGECFGAFTTAFWKKMFACGLKRYYRGG